MMTPDELRMEREKTIKQIREIRKGLGWSDAQLDAAGLDAMQDHYLQKVLSRSKAALVRHKEGQ